MKTLHDTYRIVSMCDHPGGLDEAIAYYHSKWGRENNYAFFEDAIKNSNENDLPQFFVLLKNDRIIGCCGLIMNDFISRQDLYPWLCGVYVDESERNRGLGGKLLAHAEKEAKRAGYETLYLITGHIGYYERYGWTYIGEGYEPSGESTRMYRKVL